MRLIFSFFSLHYSLIIAATELLPTHKRRIRLHNLLGSDSVNYVYFVNTENTSAVNFRFHLQPNFHCARVSRKGVFPSRFPLDVTAADSLQNNNLNPKNVSHDTKQPPGDLDIGSQAPSSS
ncbi:unnamed protein product, partial [Protopolystoma xenopodis]